VWDGEAQVAGYLSKISARKKARTETDELGVDK